MSNFSGSIACFGVGIGGEYGPDSFVFSDSVNDFHFPVAFGTYRDVYFEDPSEQFAPGLFGRCSFVCRVLVFLAFAVEKQHLRRIGMFWF